MPDEKIISLSTQIVSTHWFGMDAIALETSALRVVTVPAMGGKIVSLFDRAGEREWLLPPKTGHLQPVAYGAAFVEQDMSGWDEMFPTIERCVYPEGVYSGVELPDHGEVWALHWEQEAPTSATISLRVAGRRLPYQLSRKISIAGERTVRLNYEVINTGAEPFGALWAAHPQFVVDEATRIVLPASVKQVISVEPTGELPLIGQVCDWAETTTRDGRVLHLDRIRGTNQRRHHKVYVSPEQPVRWAAVQQGEAGAWLRLSWEVSEVPYLGIWVDERSFNPVATVALEPSTGFYDSLTRAWGSGRVMHLLPDVPYRWSLELELGQGEIPEDKTR